MPEITEGNLTFVFPEGWSVAKYDDWRYYRDHFVKMVGGIKAVDLIAVSPERCCWFVEIKDYRQFPRRKSITEADEVAGKVMHTCAALVAARLRATEAAEREAAERILRCTALRIVLHYELPAKPFAATRARVDPARLQQSLKQRLKPIDPHPKVVSLADLRGIPWTVRSKTGNPS